MGLKDSIEENLLQGYIVEKKDKNVIDTILSKEETLKTRNLLTKKELSEKDFVYLLDANVGTELKLHYLDEKERYVLGKFESVWVAKIVRMAKKLAYFKEKKKEEYNELSENEKKLFDSTLFYTKDLADWSIHVYKYWARSGLSVMGKGVEEITKHKFDISYNEPQHKTGGDI